ALADLGVAIRDIEGAQGTTMADRRKGGQKITLTGWGGEEAASRRIPDDVEALECPPGMDTSGSSPKRAAEDGEGPRGKRRERDGGSGMVAGLDLDQMEKLLEVHSTRILKAQRENLEGMMSLFEAKTDEKLRRVEEKAEGADRRAAAIEDKVEQLQGQMADLLRTGKGTAGRDNDRRFTLVFGGWCRDTRKGVILQQLGEALERLQLSGHLDAEPFCTGPRRSTALAVFSHRGGESDYQVRKRMHSVIMGLAGNTVTIPHGKTLFATYSKTRAERAIAGHASWVKRSLATLGDEVVSMLDVEYATGTCWIGGSTVASATRPSEPGVREEGLLRDEVEGHKTWVDVEAIAKETRQPYRDIKKALEGEHHGTLGELTKQRCHRKCLAGNRGGTQTQLEDGRCLVIALKGGGEGPTTLPVLLAADINAQIRWEEAEDGSACPSGRDGKAVGYLDAIAGRGLQLAAPHRDQFDTPTSQPRQGGRQGRQIDCIASKGVLVSRLQIFVGTARALGTDHDMLQCRVHMASRRERVVHSTRPRVWTGGPPVIDNLDQNTLRELAKTCTRPKPGKGYRDPPDVKAAVRAARVSQTGVAWKEVQNRRKQARKQWEEKRIREAMAGDWEQVRQLRATKNTGWDTHYAECQGEGEAHRSIHNHLASIYQTGSHLPELEAWRGEVQAFTEDELKSALSSGKTGKAVGIDQTSLELRRGICATEGGMTHLLEFYKVLGGTVLWPLAALPMDQAELELARAVADDGTLLTTYSRAWFEPLWTEWRFHDEAKFGAYAIDDPRHIEEEVGRTETLLPHAEDQGRESFQSDAALSASQVRQRPSQGDAGKGKHMGQPGGHDRGLGGPDRRVVYSRLHTDYKDPELPDEDGMKENQKISTANSKLWLQRQNHQPKWPPHENDSGLIDPDRRRVYPLMPADYMKPGLLEEMGPALPPEAEHPRDVKEGVPTPVQNTAAVGEKVHPMQTPQDGQAGNAYLEELRQDLGRDSPLLLADYMGPALPEEMGSALLEEVEDPGDVKEGAPTREENAAAEGEEVHLMQTPQDGQAWIAYLEALRRELEGADKEAKLRMAQYLLCRLDWRSTDAREGYWLGHMTGKVADMTALLVAAMDRQEADLAVLLPTVAEGLWAEAERAEPSKRQCLMVEIAANTGGDAALATSLRVPLHDGTADLNMRITVQENGSSDQETVRVHQEANETEPANGLLPFALTWSTGAMDHIPPTFMMARDQLARLRREGWTRRQQASMIYVLVQRRGHEEYLSELPNYLAQLDLDLDVDLSPHNLPTAPPVMEWIEAEIWDEYIDFFESNAGAETEVETGGAADYFGDQHGENQVTLSKGHMCEAGEEMNMPETADADGDEDQSQEVEDESVPHPGHTEEMLHAALDRGLLRRPGDYFPAAAPDPAREQANAREWKELAGMRVEHLAVGATAKRELKRMNERDLGTMFRALMRLMGMLYIEMTRILTQVQDYRLRMGDMVEVEVEDDEEEQDEESIYMQVAMDTRTRPSWEQTLQQLVRQGDEQGNAELMRALRRRISSSLYMQTSRGVQLHAALTAVAADPGATLPQCETAPQDASQVEQWWKHLKTYLNLVDEDRDNNSAGSSGDRHHSAAEVAEWKRERGELAEERLVAQGVKEQEETAREQEQDEQNRQDSELYEAHRAAVYRDWEHWLVLNTPNVQKRRRLVITSRTGQPTTPNEPNVGNILDTTTLTVPNMATQFHLQLHMEDYQEAIQPEAKEIQPGVRVGASEDKYQRVYKAWKAGHIDDLGVELLFGAEWVILFHLEAENGGEAGDEQGTTDATQRRGTIWLDGEVALEFCDASSPLLKCEGPLALDPTVKGLQLQTMSPDLFNVWSLQMPLGVWICRANGTCKTSGLFTRNAASSSQCWRCKSSRVRSAFRPPGDSDPRHPGIKIFTTDSFEELLEANPCVFLALSADWCGACQRMKPAWFALAKLLKSSKEVTVGVMNIDENDVDKKYFPERHIPVIKLLVKKLPEDDGLDHSNDKPVVISYEGGHDIASWLQFLGEHTELKLQDVLDS
ncbi:unnamed protein product, partial [Symbiodinium sp. CCMP2456]